MNAFGFVQSKAHIKTGVRLSVIMFVSVFTYLHVILRQLEYLNKILYKFGFT